MLDLLLDVTYTMNSGLERLYVLVRASNSLIHSAVLLQKIAHFWIKMRLQLTHFLADIFPLRK